MRFSVMVALFFLASCHCSIEGKEACEAQGYIHESLGCGCYEPRYDDPMKPDATMPYPQGLHHSNHGE